MSQPELDAMNRSLAEVRKERDDLRVSLRTAKDWLVTVLEWVDAVPQDTPLPNMPGFNRDELDAFVTKDAVVVSAVAEVLALRTEVAALREALANRMEPFERMQASLSTPEWTEPN